MLPEASVACWHAAPGRVQEPQLGEQIILEIFAFAFVVDTNSKFPDPVDVTVWAGHVGVQSTFVNILCCTSVIE